MIPYVPEPFIDRSVQYPGRRYITRPDSTVELCQISRSHEGQNAEGAIYAEGTPLNAESFNGELTKVKDTFDSIDTDLQAKQPALTAGSGILIQNNVISATGGSGTAAYLAGLADVGLYAPLSGEVLLFDGSQGKWINGDIVTGKKSGAVVAFGDGAGDLPVKDLNVEIKATQSGTGDPSPNNVRPISGWANVGVTRAKKNLYQFPYVLTLNLSGSGQNRTVVDSQLTCSSIIPLKPGTTYTLSGNRIGASDTFGRLATFSRSPQIGDVSIRFLSYSNNNSLTFTAAADELFALVLVSAGESEDCHMQLEVGSTPTTYEPYVTPTNVTIALGQTVFGGELDVTSGVLTITWASRTFTGTSEESWGTGSSFDFRYNVSDMKSGRYMQFFADWLTTVGADAGTAPSIRFGASNTYIYLLNILSNIPTVTDLASFKTYLSTHPLQIVYELATPVTVQLTGTEIETILGINNIWADSGDILNLEYYRDEAKKIIDLFQFDESLKAWTAENFAPLYTDVEGTLLAGETYLILNSPKIFTTSTIDIYTDTFGVAPYAIEVQNGNVRLTFVARASDLNVKVRIT